MKYVLDEVLDVNINGDMQNIHIRSNAPEKDVVLFVHGGPGVPDRSWVMPKQSKYLADKCVMVCWDQRMSGKSYNSKNTGNHMTLDMMVEDMHGLVEYLKKRFNKEQIIFVGHSWGSILGVLYLQKYADTIKSYVGMGQFVNGPLNEKMSYDFVMDYAKEHNDTKAIKDLERIGAPVDGRYKGGIPDLNIQRDYMTKYGGGCYKEKESILKSVVMPFVTSGEYSIIKDFIKYYKGCYFCLNELWDQVVALKYDETVKELNTNVYLFQGDHDMNTPTVLAKKWFDELKAPYKEYVSFAESAHSPIKEEPELWAKNLIEKVLDK